MFPPPLDQRERGKGVQILTISNRLKILYGSVSFHDISILIKREVGGAYTYIYIYIPHETTSGEFFFFFWNACWRPLYFNGSLRWLTGGRKQIARQIILVIDRFTQRIINNSARFRPFEHSILFSLHTECDFDFSENRYFISSSSPILLSNVQRGGDVESLCLLSQQFLPKNCFG